MIKMKRFAGMLLTLVLTFSLAACGSDRTESADANETETEVTESAEDSKDAGNVLIIYFSANNRNDVDSVSSATPVADRESAVGWIADIIHDNVGGEVVKIIPAEDYPTGYDETADQAKQEADSDARPAFKELGVDPASYDTIFIGYPIWWYKMPQVMETFFDTYDLSGKIVIPFNTHEGSGDSGTYSDIAEREPDSVVLDGLAISGGDVFEDDTKTKVEEWLKGLDLD
jgi:flavodoxin